MVENYIIVELLIAAGVGLLSSAWLLWLRRIGLRALTRLARRTESQLDDLALSAFWLPSLLWCLVLGVYIGLTAAHVMPSRMGQLVNDVLVIALILSVTIAVGRFLAASVVFYVDRLGLAIAVTGLTTALVKGAVYLCGALVLLNTLGISITPILTALGVGGLAVALALQGSLGSTSWWKNRITWGITSSWSRVRKGTWSISAGGPRGSGCYPIT